MSATAKQKGDALERSTAFIQDALLKNHPEFKTANYILEPKKKVMVNGTQHEIDVLVTTAPGSPYKAQVLFECKNQEVPVDKNEPMILAGKVEALAANSGVLVCRELTSGAKAFIENHPRLSWIQCSDDFTSPFNDLVMTHIMHDFLPMKAWIKRLETIETDKVTVWDWHTAVCIENFRPISFSAYLKKQVDEFVEKDRKDYKKLYEHEGVHWRALVWEIIYDFGEFKVNGWGVETMQIELRFFAHVMHRKIRSRFELEGQGRHWEFEPIQDPFSGETLVVDAVEILPTARKK